MDKMRCPLDKAADIYENLPALICSERTFSYREYRNLVSAAAKRIDGLGFETGERVGLLWPNDWRYVVVILALLRRRAIVCPLDTRTPVQGVRALLDQIACQKVIVSFEHSDDPSVFGRKTFDVRELITFGDRGGESTSGVEIDLDRSATIVFTSGSLGMPKAVLHSYANHYYNAKGSNHNIPLQPDDRWLLALPLYHVGGLGIVFRCLLGGAAVVIPEKDERLEESLDRYSVTHLSCVPTQLHRLLCASAAKQLSGTLKAIVLGGAPFPSNLIREGLARGLPVYTSYGLTEMASQVTTTSSDAPREKRSTSGKVLPFRQIRVSENGEILVKGETLFKGYVVRDGPDLPVDAGGWFATGDLGQFDAEGYLTVTGRKDNMFISGGENIQPEEIEMVLRENSTVADALVVPVLDEEFGNRPVAFIRTHDGELNAQLLVEFLEPRVARYKIPIAFYDWPKTVGSDGLKVNRAFLQRLAAQKTGSNRTA